MSKPLVKIVNSSTIAAQIKFVAKGDEYKDLNGGTHIYEKSKVMVAIAGSPKPIEIPKEIFDALQDFLGEPEIQQKLKDWV